MINNYKALIKFWLIAFILTHLIILIASKHYWTVLEQFGDNGPYSTISTAFYNADLSYMKGFYKHFWGLPFLMTLVRWPTGMNENFVIVLLSLLFSSLSLYYVSKLYSISTAFIFAFFSIDWIQRSFLGGAEPLFIALTFSSLYLYSQNNNSTSDTLKYSSLAALSCLVRPVGIFLLISIGLDQIHRREFKKLSISVCSSLIIGGIYLAIVYQLTGSAFAHFQTYHETDWNSSSPLALPFVNLFKSFMALNFPLLNTVKVSLWVILSSLTAIMMIFNAGFKAYFQNHKVQLYYFLLHFLFVVSYNSTEWAWSQLPRFIVPILPIIACLISRYLRFEKYLLPALYLLGTTLASLSAISIYEVITRVKSLLG